MNMNKEGKKLGYRLTRWLKSNGRGARFGRTSRTEWVSKGSVLKAKRYKPNQKERLEGKRKDEQTRGRMSCFSGSRTDRTTPWCVVRMPIPRD